MLMVTYMNELPVSSQLTGNILLKMLLNKKELRQAESHGFFSEDHGFVSFSSSDEDRAVALARNENQGLTALQIRKREKCGHRLCCDYILNEKARLLNIRTVMETFACKKPAPAGNPDAVSMLLCRLAKEGYLETDAGLKVSPAPLIITESDTDLMKRLAGPFFPFRLPVILVVPAGLPPLRPDAGSLAEVLCGAAHVLVFENRKAFRRFRKLQVPVSFPAGPLLIRYPSEKAFKRFPLPAWHNPAPTLSNDLFRHRAEASRLEENTFGRICEEILSWEALSGEEVRKAHARLLSTLDQEKKRMISEASDHALEEAQKIVEDYESDIKKLKDELYEKSLLAAGLEVENERLRSRMPRDRIPVLYLGKEKEFYQGEIQDLLLSSLEKVLKNTPRGCRRWDVIKDILASNDYRHISKDRSDEVHRLLRSYNGMTQKIQRGLSDLGFSVEKAQDEHYKVLYHGDGRYMTVLAGSPSDVRSGQNNASLIIRLAF